MLILFLQVLFFYALGWSITQIEYVFLVIQVAEKSLADVKLIAAARVRSGSYSGGMKRRLSVAIALIGDPKLVFLDEPVSCC